MYTDYYLKFNSQEEAESVLYRIEGAVEANSELNIEAKEGYKVPNYRNIDIIGTIYEKQEITNPENPPESIPLDGYHVNVRLVSGESGESLEPFRVIPTTPMRVWG